MTHMFRKYLSNRGSALFMVLSTMTALMICCMAMYFSVVSSRSTQYAVFNQQQASSTSVSLKDTILAALDSRGAGRSPQGTQLANIMAYMIAKNVDTITTGANGFEAFGETIDPKELDPSYWEDIANSSAGAYSVTITRIGDAEFDIAVTTSVNGVKDVTHVKTEFAPPADVPGPPPPTKLIAATGYIPNDVFFEGGSFHSNLFFDNEYTLIAAYGGNYKSLSGDLSTGGSLFMYGAQGGALTPENTAPVTYAIRGNYEHFHNSPLIFNATTGRSTLMIGGNYTMYRTGGVQNANAYVLGNMYVMDNSLCVTNAEYYVRGDVYLCSVLTGDNVLSKIHCDGTIYLINQTPMVQIDELQLTGETVSCPVKWSNKTGDDFLTPSEMLDELLERTAEQTYYKWIINMDDIVGVTKENISFIQTTWWDNHSVTPEVTKVLKWSPDHQGCIITDIQTVGNSYNNVTIIVDTGLDENNVYTIEVRPNYDLDGDGVKETFMWQPVGAQSTHPNILLKGRGSLVINIPKGVIYQDEWDTRVMHYGWAVLSGKFEEDTEFGTEEDKIIYKSGIFGDTEAELFSSFIHQHCVEGDGCEYTEPLSGGKCNICESDMKSIKCSVHGVVTEFCPKCQEHLAGADHIGSCEQHVHRPAIDEYLKTHPDMKAKMMGADGELIYPTTNIFLVSCEESADIRLTQKLNGNYDWEKRVEGNSFFGFIYAPYMTFKCMGGGSGGFKLMGGMTVSDYVYYDAIDMVACWPDKMPTDIMSAESTRNPLQGVAAKDWKTTPHI